MEVPDYNYLSTDTVRPMSEMVGKWLNVQKGQLDVQKTQSEQVAGQLAQQAIDPTTGQFDPAKFNALLAKTPGAAFAAFPSMKETSALRGANIDQNLTVNAHVNAAVTAALASDDDHIRQAVIEQAGRLRSILPPDQVDHALLGLRGDNPAELRRQLETVRVGTLPPQQKQDWIHGTRQVIDTPGAHYIVDQPRPGTGAVTVTPKGPAPGDVTTSRVLVDDQGIIPLDANGRPTRPNGRYQEMPVHTGTVPGIPQGGPPQTTWRPGSTSTSAAPGLPPGAPPPLPGQRLVKGRFVTPPAAPAPNASTPTPAAAPAVPAQPPASTPPAATPPASTAKPPVFTSPPQGQPDILQKDIDAHTAANMAMGDQQKRLIAGQHALEALKLADTGPSTGFFARAYAFLKAQGITTVERGQLSDTDYRQLLQKNLLRFAQSSGKDSGTNLGLETKIHENANVDDMLAGANRQVLLQDMGVLKRDIAQTQEMPKPSGAGDVVAHVGRFSANTVPEAFMWNHYTQSERDAIEAQYAKDGKTKQLHDSLELAVKRGAIPDPRKAAQPSVPQKQSFLAPPQPAQNALQMTG